MKNKWPDKVRSMYIVPDFPLHMLSYIRIGGTADAMAFPKNEAELLHLMACLRENGVPWRVVGNASNMLFHDAGYRGCMISLAHFSRNMTIDGETVRIYGDMPIGHLLHHLVQAGLSGLEFLYGIPGYVLPSVLFNVGTGSSSFEQTLSGITFLDHTGQIQTAEKDVLQFGYRQKICESVAILLGAVFHVTQKSKDIVMADVQKIKQYRVRLHPNNARSLGCTFRNPKEHMAGRLIDAVGCKGQAVNAIAVSSQHANFFINHGQGKAADYMRLLERVQKQVWRYFGIMLEPEIHCLGEC